MSSLRVVYDSEQFRLDTFDDTTTKGFQIAQALEHGPIELDWLAPYHTITTWVANHLDLIHDREYIEAVRTGGDRWLAESSGLEWSPRMYTSARSSTASVLTAIDLVADNRIQVAGTLASGLHHARRDQGSGFCTFNGLALGAWFAVRELSFNKVAILDVDAHNGGGTYELLQETGLSSRVRHYDISTNGYDDYDVVNPWDYRAVVHGGDDPYLAKVQWMLEEMDPGDLVIVNAGVDPFDDGISPQALAMRDEFIFDALVGEVPVAFTIAGGYTYNQTMEQLVQLHLGTFYAAAAPLPYEVPRGAIRFGSTTV